MFLSGILLSHLQDKNTERYNSLHCKTWTVLLVEEVLFPHRLHAKPVHTQPGQGKMKNKENKEWLLVLSGMFDKNCSQMVKVTFLVKIIRRDPPSASDRGI